MCRLGAPKPHDPYSIWQASRKVHRRADGWRFESPASHSQLRGARPGNFQSMSGGKSLKPVTPLRWDQQSPRRRLVFDFRGTTHVATIGTGRCAPAIFCTLSLRAIELTFSHGSSNTQLIAVLQISEGRMQQRSAYLRERWHLECDRGCRHTKHHLRRIRQLSNYWLISRTLRSATVKGGLHIHSNLTQRERWSERNRQEFLIQLRLRRSPVNEWGGTSRADRGERGLAVLLPHNSVRDRESHSSNIERDGRRGPIHTFCRQAYGVDISLPAIYGLGQRNVHARVSGGRNMVDRREGVFRWNFYDQSHTFTIATDPTDQFRLSPANVGRQRQRLGMMRSSARSVVAIVNELFASMTGYLDERNLVPKSYIRGAGAER